MKKHYSSINIQRNLISISLVIIIIFAVQYRLTEKIFINHKFQGEAIGTSFSIKLTHTPLKVKESKHIQNKIFSIFRSINTTCSVFERNSDVSIFNHQVEAFQDFVISDDLFKIIKRALEISKKTHGSFDITVSPLINLWGFGEDGKRNIPSAEEVEEKLKVTGADKLLLLGKNILQKKINGVSINLGAIAKGYAVDKIASFLVSLDCKNFMIEVGGEVYCSGLNRDFENWTIGIDTPDSHLIPGENIMGVTTLNRQAIATSGNYRRFFKYGKKIYSHIINPKTGYPVDNNLVSVSVITSNCMEADAYATAFFVLGYNKSIEIVEKDSNLEAYFILKEDDGIFKSYKSSGFKLIDSSLQVEG